MTSSKSRVAALSLASCVAAAATSRAAPMASGPSVTFLLSLNDDGTGKYAKDRFALYASDSTADGNPGISGFNLSLGNTLSVNNVAPKAFFDDGTGTGNTVQTGFTFFRSANGSQVHGSQDTPDYSNGVSGIVLVHGFGQTGGNLNQYAPAGSTGGFGKVQAVYNSELLIATGTYADATPVYFSAHIYPDGETTDQASVLDFQLVSFETFAAVDHETQTLSPATAVPLPRGFVGGVLALLLAPVGWLKRTRPALRK